MKGVQSVGSADCCCTVSDDGLYRRLPQQQLASFSTSRIRLQEETVLRQRLASGILWRRMSLHST